MSAWPALCMGSCPDSSPTPEQEFRASETVIVGPIVGAAFTPATNERGEGITYTVRIEEVLRGNPGKTVTLFSGAAGRNLALKKGRTYLLFIQEDRNPFEIDACGNSGPLPEKDEVLSLLRKQRGQ